MAMKAKTVTVLREEGKSHRTKAELAAREKGEKALMSGEVMREDARTKADQSAHRHFARVKKLMAAIGHADAVHEQVMNRYCMLIAECERMEEDLKAFAAQRGELRAKYSAEEIDYLEYIDRDQKAAAMKLKTEAELDRKRQMLLAIEKENLMTVQSALRAVPKTQEDIDKLDAMDELFKRRRQAQ